MLICNCMLAGSSACLNCSQYMQVFGTHYTPYFIPEYLKSKKTTEFYDEKGNLIKKVTEE